MVNLQARRMASAICNWNWLDPLVDIIDIQIVAELSPPVLIYISHSPIPNVAAQQLSLQYLNCGCLSEHAGLYQSASMACNIFHHLGKQWSTAPSTSTHPPPRGQAAQRKRSRPSEASSRDSPIPELDQHGHKVDQYSWSSWVP